MVEGGREPRGVANPRVVDLISLDGERDEVVLLMLEERAWGSVPEQTRQLEEKFNSYLAYVLDGHMVREYPEYKDKPVCFRLDSASAPGADLQPMLLAMRNFAAAEQIRFEVGSVVD